MDAAFARLQCSINEATKSLAIEVDLALTGERVTRVLERLPTTRGLPLAIQADDGQWACEHGVQLHFLQPGKPIQNAHSESFNAPRGPRIQNLRYAIATIADQEMNPKAGDY